MREDPELVELMTPREEEEALTTGEELTMNLMLFLKSPKKRPSITKLLPLMLLKLKVKPLLKLMPRKRPNKKKRKLSLLKSIAKLKKKLKPKSNFLNLVKLKLMIHGKT